MTRSEWYDAAVDTIDEMAAFINAQKPVPHELYGRQLELVQQLLDLRTEDQLRAVADLARRSVEESREDTIRSITGSAMVAALLDEIAKQAAADDTSIAGNSRISA